MTYPTTIKSVINRFEKENPKSPEEALLECGVTLQYLSGGAFREVYTIVGFPLVVKFCCRYERRDNIKHAKQEYANIQEVVAHPVLRRHAPRVHYFNPKTGVTVMQKYKRVTAKQIKKAVDSFSNYFQLTDWDGGTSNFGKDDNGRVVLLDMGYFGHCQ